MLDRTRKRVVHWREREVGDRKMEKRCERGKYLP